ncbi:MAG TPA: nucleotidyltransferase family protein [Acidimicrobiales bacterium]|nr:nucleotidyltransferase family protein [Acidimicrobiales bacterium]
MAAYGLTNAFEVPPRPLGDDEWRSMISAANGQRLAGVLARAVADGSFPASPSQQAAAAELAFRATRLDVRLERSLLRVVDLLAAAGLETRVLKGSAVAHLDYPEPGMRSFSDVDLLLRSEDFDAAVVALSSAGYRRRYPQPRPGFDRRFGKGACLVSPSQGHEIDLHRTLVLGPLGLTIPLHRLWERSSSFDLAGRSLAALAPEDRFLHACHHAVLGQQPPRLVPLRDVAQMTLSPSLDEEQVRARCREWRAEAVVAEAVRCTWDSLKIDTSTSLSLWARSYRPTRRERSALRSYAGAGTYSAKALASVRVIPGLRGKAAYVSALAFPQARYVRNRHGGRLRRWGHAIHDARRARDDR